MKPIKIFKFYEFEVHRFTSSLDMVFGANYKPEPSFCGGAPIKDVDKPFRYDDPDALGTPIDLGLVIHLAMFGLVSDIQKLVSFGELTMYPDKTKVSDNCIAVLPAMLIRAEPAIIQANAGYTLSVTYDNVEKFYPDLPKNVVTHLQNYRIQTIGTGLGVRNELELSISRNYPEASRKTGVSDTLFLMLLNNYAQTGTYAGYTISDEKPEKVTQEKPERPSWDEYFMQNAELVAVRASCDRLSVGCILVQDNRVIANGYNGSISGHEHCDQVGHLMHDGSCKRTIHAEMNAILQCANNGVSTKGATAYVTHYPCPDCMKHLAQAGIARVVYGEPYQHKYANTFAKNMVVEQFVPRTKETLK